MQSDEKPLIESAFAGHHDIRCLDVFLTEDTAPIAVGYEVVSSGVNADLGPRVLRALAAGGTKMIAQRSTGFNNIDLDAARQLGLTVARVSYYSPYSVAEFAWTLAMAVNRRIVRAAGRTRDFDFRLDGLLGRDLRGRTAGVLGTGKIGEAFTRIAHGFGMNLLGWDVVQNPACVLVNSSRGGLIDTAALVHELRQGRFTAWGSTCTRRRPGSSSSTSPWRASTTTPWPGSSPSRTSWSPRTRPTTPWTRSARSSRRPAGTSSTTRRAAAARTCSSRRRANRRTRPAPTPVPADRAARR
ncbi:NAD(P)-dependent oxidoreductase [Streptomyces sp. NPDC055287]